MNNELVLTTVAERSQKMSEGDSVELLPLADRKKGLSLWLAAIFIVGEMAGSGVLALPKALADAGWSGVVVLLVCCVNSLYSGVCLGRCWTILEERYDEYKQKNRYPYPTIAYRAMGTKMRYIVSFCIDFTLFGVATVFLLLSSQLIGNLAAQWGISFCYWILILAAFLGPLMWLGTPEDFWLAALGALGTTVIACFLLMAALAKEESVSVHVEHPAPSVTSFFLAFGTIFFSFGGAATFPTFQNDMKDRSQFPKAALIGFAVLILLYLPVAVLGYSVYGEDVKSSVIESLPDSNIKTAAEVLLAIHLTFAFLLVINTPAQEFEEFFNVPKAFGWKRCVLRSSMMVIIVFIAQTIPRFGSVLNLVGASTITLMTSIFPSLFYLKLCSQTSPEWPQRHIPTYEKVYLIFIMITGIIGGSISTYSAIDSIVRISTFNPPCYVNITAAGIQQ
ncbi:amino acid transporter AVT1J-like isoform X1 [Stegodyphus dumicola]|uniref:amino acid transporter AVT1J-like isoform X1 n=2 Tax=Stegodyphus dumicola TaxID=202533 RepID=UPI0015AC2F38|nr:amino acid transporter AVT1J-like isoform X1 [Stegodyphus dumicola]